jgi:hypothetical protein
VDAIREDDPNQTPYSVCLGIGGYSLAVRYDDIRRVSVNVIAPDKKEYPLDYWTYVTSHESALGPNAEWRVIASKRKIRPIALMVPVESHEDPADPSRLTHTYIAIAKITPEEICVTHRLSIAEATPGEIIRAADGASQSQCLASQP